MNDGFTFINDITHQAVLVTLKIAAPMLIGALVIGIIISIFQAVTQINEQTLSFIPKILVIIGAMVIFSPWMIDTLTSFTNDLIMTIPQMIAAK